MSRPRLWAYAEDLSSDKTLFLFNYHVARLPCRLIRIDLVLAALTLLIAHVYELF